MINTFDKNYYKNSNGIKIEYGIKYGNENVLFIKTGLNGSINGYNDKYLKMIEYINYEYGWTIFIASNPEGSSNDLELDLKVLWDLFPNNNMKLNYMGVSNGGLIGIQQGYKYNIDKMVCVNMPLMFNFHRTKKGIEQSNYERLTIIYGEKDQSHPYIPLIENYISKKIGIKVYKNQDHFFSYNDIDFFEIPIKYIIELKD